MKTLLLLFLVSLPLLTSCQSNGDQQPANKSTVASPPSPPPPPPPAPKVEEIFKVVEKMPRFPGCENESTEVEKDSCAHANMTRFVQKNIIYPSAAERHQIGGTVKTSFVIEKDGSVTNVKVVEVIGYGCDEEALRVLKLMQSKGLKWTPSGSRRPVRILFTFDVVFKLE